MEPRHESSRNSGIDRDQPYSPDQDPPWAKLRLLVPNTRSQEEIESFVECVLVELTHADVGAQYSTSNVFGAVTSRYIADDER